MKLRVLYFLVLAQQDEDERVKGWFPRRCVKLPEKYYSTNDSDKQTSSDAKTGQSSKQRTIEDHEDDVKAKPASLSTTSKAQTNTAQKKSKVTQSPSGGSESGASGTTPTSGARKRAKKSKTDKKKETGTTVHS